MSILAGMKALRASGTTIPSSVWYCSKMAHITLVVAHIVPFSMCTNSACVGGEGSDVMGGEGECGERVGAG